MTTQADLIAIKTRSEELPAGELQQQLAKTVASGQSPEAVLSTFIDNVEEYCSHSGDRATHLREQLNISQQLRYVVSAGGENQLATLRRMQSHGAAFPENERFHRLEEAAAFASKETFEYLFNSAGFLKPDTPDENDAEHRTQLNIQLETLFLAAAYYNNTEVVNFLSERIRHKQVTQITDDQGNNALHLAAMHGGSKTVKELLDTRFSGLNKNNNGQCALHLAVASRNEDSVRELLVHMSPLEAFKQTDKKNYTPLLLAMHMGEIPIVTQFLQCRTSVIKDRMLYQMAAFVGHPGVVECLNRANCTLHPMADFNRLLAEGGHQADEAETGDNNNSNSNSFSFLAEFRGFWNRHSFSLFENEQKAREIVDGECAKDEDELQERKRDDESDTGGVPTTTPTATAAPALATDDAAEDESDNGSDADDGPSTTPAAGDAVTAIRLTELMPCGEGRVRFDQLTPVHPNDFKHIVSIHPLRIAIKLGHAATVGRLVDELHNHHHNIDWGDLIARAEKFEKHDVVAVLKQKQAVTTHSNTHHFPDPIGDFSKNVIVALHARIAMIKQKQEDPDNDKTIERHYEELAAELNGKEFTAQVQKVQVLLSNLSKAYQDKIKALVDENKDGQEVALAIQAAKYIVDPEQFLGGLLRIFNFGNTDLNKQLKNMVDQCKLYADEQERVMTTHGVPTEILQRARLATSEGRINIKDAFLNQFREKFLLTTYARFQLLLTKQMEDVPSQFDKIMSQANMATDYFPSLNIMGFQANLGVIVPVIKNVGAFIEQHYGLHNARVFLAAFDSLDFDELDKAIYDAGLAIFEMYEMQLRRVDVKSIGEVVDDVVISVTNHILEKSIFDKVKGLGRVLGQVFTSRGAATSEQHKDSVVAKMISGVPYGARTVWGSEEPITTIDGNVNRNTPWTIRGMFIRVGILAEDGCVYGSDNTDINKYGYRLGSLKEVEKLGYIYKGRPEDFPLCTAAKDDSSVTVYAPGTNNRPLAASEIVMPIYEQDRNLCMRTYEFNELFCAFRKALMLEDSVLDEKNKLKLQQLVNTFYQLVWTLRANSDTWVDTNAGMLKDIVTRLERWQTRYHMEDQRGFELKFDCLAAAKKLLVSDNAISHHQTPVRNDVAICRNFSWYNFAVITATVGASSLLYSLATFMTRSRSENTTTSGMPSSNFWLGGIALFGAGAFLGGVREAIRQVHRP